MKPSDQIDDVETIIATLLYANGEEDDYKKYSSHKRNKTMDFDAGLKLRFDPVFPKLAHTAQLSSSREFALDPRLLLNTPQDIIGRMSEIVMIDGLTTNWIALKKLNKRPKGVWVSRPGADLYEYHQRVTTPNGVSSYQKSVAAIGKGGEVVNTIIEGTVDTSSFPKTSRIVLAASLIEDSFRPNTFQATVKENIGLIFPVENGEHLDVFRLRDGPMIGNRRKQLIHWVSKHTRRISNGTTSEVKQHLRGVHQFDIDGLSVTLNAHTTN